MHSCKSERRATCQSVSGTFWHVGHPSLELTYLVPILNSFMSGFSSRSQYEVLVNTDRMTRCMYYSVESSRAAPPLAWPLPIRRPPVPKQSPFSRSNLEAHNQHVLSLPDAGRGQRSTEAAIDWVLASRCHYQTARTYEVSYLRAGAGISTRLVGMMPVLPPSALGSGL